VLVADAQLAGFPSVMVDAIALELSKKGCEMLLVEAAAIQFVMDAFGHLKAIGATEAAKPLLDKAGVEPDAGIVPIDECFVQAAGRRYGAGSIKYARSPEVSVLVDSCTTTSRSYSCTKHSIGYRNISPWPSFKCVLSLQTIIRRWIMGHTTDKIAGVANQAAGKVKARYGQSHRLKRNRGGGACPGGQRQGRVTHMCGYNGLNRGWCHLVFRSMPLPLAKSCASDSETDRQEDRHCRLISREGPPNPGCNLKQRSPPGCQEFV
jgi:hypothetical protein